MSRQVTNETTARGNAARHVLGPLSTAGLGLAVAAGLGRDAQLGSRFCLRSLETGQQTDLLLRSGFSQQRRGYVKTYRNGSLMRPAQHTAKAHGYRAGISVDQQSRKTSVFVQHELVLKLTGSARRSHGVTTAYIVFKRLS